MKQVDNYQTNQIKIEHSHEFVNSVNDLYTSDFVLRSKHVLTTIAEVQYISIYLQFGWSRYSQS